MAVHGIEGRYASALYSAAVKQAGCNKRSDVDVVEAEVHTEYEVFFLYFYKGSKLVLFLL